MKIIFTKDVPKVGRRNEVKDMPDGYVRNFLLPKGVAILATPEALKKLTRAQEEVRVEREIQEDLLKKNLDHVAGTELTITSKANDKGHLFKAIHEKDIASALKKIHVVIDPKFLKLSAPIKEIGEHKVIVDALGKKETISVTVRAQ